MAHNDKQKTNADVAKAGIAGAVVGATAAVTVMALQDKKTRAKMQRTLHAVSKAGKQHIDKWQAKASKMGEIAQDAQQETKNTIEEAAEERKNAIQGESNPT